MVTVILPGYSVHNKQWLEETAQKIDADGEIRTVYWDHWTNPEKKFNAKDKGRIINDIAGIRMVDIIAKSIGTLVAAYLIQKSPLKIRKVIFCGIPLNDLSENDKEAIKLALKSIPFENIICFQNEEDPHASFGSVKRFLSGINSKVELISKPGSDHEYPYYNDFKNFLLG